MKTETIVNESVDLHQYLTVRKHSEKLCKPLQTEDYVAQPVTDVSPPKWHLAHTTWFFEEFVLSQNVRDYRRFHPQFAFLFNSYYESVGERVLRPNRGNLTRPTVQEIYKYRKYVDEQMELHFESFSEDVLHLIELGLHHEQQHQELLLTDIKYILGHNPLFPPYDPSFEEWDNSSAEGFVSFKGGNNKIGYSGDEFHYDNEAPLHEVFVEPFDIAKMLVTNEEYLEFIENGGYKDPKYWYSDAWAWINEENIRSPLYWYKIEGDWHRYALKGLQKLPLHEPVTHISHYEAAAYAEWRGMRLPTEFEWELASDKLNWGQRWEHTSSAYLPYPGYKKPAGAVGEYNGKFMINQMVLKGASIATPNGHARTTYRNFFHPHLQWQFSGIRLCKKL